MSVSTQSVFEVSLSCSMQGYWSPRGLIVTQGPLPNTVADFWMMVYQKKVMTIVMLSDCTEDDTVCMLCLIEFEGRRKSPSIYLHGVAHPAHEAYFRVSEDSENVT